MASPLTYLRRLMSRGGERKRINEEGDGAKPDQFAIAQPMQTTGEQKLEAESADVLGSSPSPSDTLSAGPATADEAGRTANAQRDSTGGSEVSASGSHQVAKIAVTSAPAAERAKPTVGRAVREKRRRDGRAKPALTIGTSSADLQTDWDDPMSLDEEIKVLRGQLAAKLQVQNAQLKRMLARFQT
ncbi:hypothetical protein [Pseudorhizobium tarimense]